MPWRSDTAQDGLLPSYRLPDGIIKRNTPRIMQRNIQKPFSNPVQLVVKCFALLFTRDHIGKDPETGECHSPGS